MHGGKHILTALVILLGVFVLVASVSALITLPAQLETSATPLRATQHQETDFHQPPSSSESGELEEAPGYKNAAIEQLNVSSYTPTPGSALVNILCFTKEKSPLSPISGSGIIIDKRGVILTTAHIAQYFLLEEYAECVIRQGAPAVSRYQAELLYISPVWVTENRHLIGNTVSQGTGENDYAFLRIITGGGDFLYIPPDPEASVIKVTVDGDGNEIEEVDLDVEMRVSVLAYPSEFLESTNILQHLLPISTQAVITKLFTFDDQTLDLLSLQGTPLAQQGSSGGGVVGRGGYLKALVVSSTHDGPLRDRELRAITLGHINRSLEKDLGKDIHEFLSEDLHTTAISFRETAQPSLMTTLQEELRR